MENREKHQGFPHIPIDVIFEYEENKSVPVRALNADGTEYTGKASGTIKYIDWNGTYESGLPHGQFYIVFGDKVGRYVNFENGNSVETT